MRRLMEAGKQKNNDDNDDNDDDDDDDRCAIRKAQVSFTGFG